MHRPTLLCLALASAAFAEDPKPLLPPAAAEGYQLVWSDEFNGEKLDATAWNIRTGDRFASRNQAANVSVSGGQLHLAVRKEKAGELDYTSGGVISKREFLYGYYEASFRVPKSAGWHTSFWMMKNGGKEKGNRQEVDVVEQDSKDLTGYGANLHTHHPTHVGRGGKRVKTPNLATAFHTWGCEFLPTEIRYYFDGKLVLTKDATAFQHDLQSIWLTTVGWAKLPWAPQLKIDDAGLPASADYEYVRYFAKPGAETPAPTAAQGAVGAPGSPGVAAEKPVTWVVFGDSLTEGGALPKDQREQAWVRIVERESAGRLRLINEGKGGRPTAAEADFRAMLPKHPGTDGLVLALGTNDSRDLTPACVPKATEHLRAMALAAREAWGEKLRIVILGPPNLNKAALGPTKPIANERDAQIRALGESFQKLAAELHADYLSLYGTVPESSLTKDGVHPDAAGNAAMARAILPKLLR